MVSPNKKDYPEIGFRLVLPKNNIMVNGTPLISINLEWKWPSGMILPAWLVYVEGGYFQMGGADNAGPPTPVHTVRVSDFAISKWEVTQRFYEEVMGENPSAYKGDNLPVENVSWYDAVKFCNTLSQKIGLIPAYEIRGDVVSWNIYANGYRLPTEAEWEYAARGGQKSKGYIYAGSNTLEEVAVHYPRTKAIGGKKSNELGLYDMSGNVAEWCWDWFDINYYENSKSRDPIGPGSGSNRVIRGGCTDYPEEFFQVTVRGDLSPDVAFSTFGFRIVMSLPERTKGGIRIPIPGE